MNERTLTARHALGGTVVGEALVAHDGFSARYDLNRLTGVFSRPTHVLVGQSYVGKILVLDTAKGGVASAWMLHEMQARHMAPLAIVFNSVNPILVQGAALAGISMLAGFDADVTKLVPHLSTVELDPVAKTLRVMAPGTGTGASVLAADSRTLRFHGGGAANVAAASSVHPTGDKP